MTTTIYLSLSDPEYDKISTFFRETYPNSCIVWVEKIDNPDLLSNYEEYKKTIPEPNEKLLFHGTTEPNARKIIHLGFDPSLNKAFAYGKGVYFSKRSIYSRDFSMPSKDELAFMLLCSVVIGKVTKGSRGEKIPKDYNSFTNSIKNPDMYIVNRREAIMPRYLVAFYPAAN